MVRVARWVVFVCVLGCMLSTRAATPPFVPTAYESRILATAPTLNAEVLNSGLWARQRAKTKGVALQTHYLVIIDYSLPSNVPRLWVIDLLHHRSSMNLLVAHGIQSGGLYARSFSNDNNSHKSSLGVFLTGGSYQGADGYSLVLEGLEPHFNDHVLLRHIVIHGDARVNDKTIATYGLLPRSWGCPMVDQRQVHRLINTVKGGSLVFIYYPNSRWLRDSYFLQA